MAEQMVNFFYVKDTRHEHRLFSSEPPALPSKPSKAKAVWELAKRKLMLLPQRTLRQEQACGRSLRIPDAEVCILHGSADSKWLNTKFHFFLNRLRFKRLLMLIGELILVPITGFFMLLPGPNVIFYALALIIITHWQSFRGIRHLLKKEFIYEARPALEEWEAAVGEGREADYPALIDKIEKEFGLVNLRKVLWK